MANKTQQIFELSQETAQKLSDVDNWTAFLRSATWQYKYPFEDQLLIYAQRPDATACASLEVWNNKLHRWINKGAKGIALLRENERGHYLDYVFDISDTNSFYGNEVKLWNYRGRYDDEIIETLENTFGNLEVNTNLIDAVNSAAHNAVDDGKSDYLDELQYAKQNSFLDGYDELNLDVKFQRLAENSVAYLILCRMGLAIAGDYEREDFQDIVDFNTPETLSVLGNAVSDISEQALREISDTIRKAERVEKNKSKFFAVNEKAIYNESNESMQDIQNEERNEKNDGADIHAERGLSDAEPDGGGTEPANRQIRDDAIEIPQKQPTEPVLSHENQGDIDGTPDRNGQDSERASGMDGIADGTSGGRGRTNESGQSAGMGRTDEQLQAQRRRNRNQPPSAQLSLFDLLPTEEEQKNIIREAAQHTFSAAFSMPQQIIDEVLCDGTNEKDSTLRTCIAFSKNKPFSEKAEYLKSEYGTDGKGFLLNGSKVSALWDKDGIRISYGTSAKNAKTVLSWEDAAKRIDELLDIGRFAPTDILLQMQDYERKYVSKAFWNQYSNLDFEEYPELSNLFDEEMLKGGYPEREERTANALKTPERIAKLQGIVHRLSEMYLENPAIMRYRVKQDPISIDILVSDLSLERKTYTAENAMRTPPNRYITDDEINRLLCGGSGVSGGKLRIYQFFTENADKKERIAFLKNEYGWGGRYDGISNENHDAKGITYSHGDITEPYAKILLKWNEVEKRIDKLIANEQYLNEAELVHLQIQELDEMPPIQERQETPELNPPEEQQRIDISGETLTEQSFEEFFNQIHSEDHGNTVALFPVGDFYEAFGEDAEQVSKTLDIYSTNKAIDGTVYPMTGFPKHALEQNVNALNENGFDVVLVDEGRKSTEKALGKIVTELSQMTEDEKQGLVDGVELAIDYNIDIPKEDVQLYNEIIEERENKDKPETTSAFRFYVIETDDGYAVWDDLQEGIYVDEEGISEEFTSEWQANAYCEGLNHSDAQEHPTPKSYVPAKQELENRMWEQLEKVKDTRGYEAFRSDVQNLLRDRTGDSLVGIAADTWTKQILAMSDDELKDYAENYTRDTLDAYALIREPATELELLGKEFTLDDRRFIVDNVNADTNTVSLKDITFQNSTGFPIFRSESVDFVNAILSKQEQPQLAAPKIEKTANAANTVIYPDIPMTERTNFVITNDELGYGTPKEKFRKNMAAIKVLKACEFDHRLATPEEQEVLSQYVGWGGLADAFDETKSNWADEFTELYTTLSPEEYESARASTLTSHFTPPVVIKAMYQALSNMGFTQGNILEPSCGIGNFMGLVPERMSESKIYGIELDGITGRIAQQLYQKNSVAIQGYEDTTLPDSFFDAAIGNVPFGDYKLMDQKYNKHNFLIHDYFFAKTLDKVRPGGVIAFITSSGTMDKQNSKVRRYIAQRADLIGAIRLPNNTFKKNAGTEVTADILFLQKRERMTDIMPDWVNIGQLENGHTINQYFIGNPDMVMGELKEVSGPFGPTLTCMPDESTELAEQLDSAIQNIHAQITEYEFDDISNDKEITIPADPNVKNFSYTVVDGDIYFRENSMMRKVELNATAENRIKGLIEIRDCVRTLIEYQTEGYADYAITAQQAKLNTLYDGFTKKIRDYQFPRQQYGVFR